MNVALLLALALALDYLLGEPRRYHPLVGFGRLVDAIELRLNRSAATQMDGVLVGCCGLLKHDHGVYEVSKMAVMHEHQGRGIGRELLRAMILHARSIGARRLEIISSTQLDVALHLYRSLGFLEVPLASDAYARGNIALALDLAEKE